ncbi:hypothetical protein BLNAU_5151 [Blattamonas nauphoetae]|uniref:Uncharacterized protein n=1 Tax=Blattamonas nauphoetae TaxID=2049346 RepID=A0ABQ9Y8D4_9EUKA|nr:hypothetical protein BLNAU_5151 [Blattamonas nauphoetae]
MGLIDVLFPPSHSITRLSHVIHKLQFNIVWLNLVFDLPNLVSAPFHDSYLSLHTVSASLLFKDQLRMSDLEFGRLSGGLVHSRSENDAEWEGTDVLSEQREIGVKSKLDIQVTIPPFTFEAKAVSLKGHSLFTVSDEASLFVVFLPPTRFLNHGASHQYQFGGWRNPLCSSRSLVILLKDSGRSVKLTTQDYSSSAVVANITKTGDGAVVNTGNADVLLYQVHLFDCHARNGGAAFLQKCQHVYVDDMLTLRCSVESKGGAIFVLSVDRNSDINLQPTLIECSDKLGG